MIKTEQVIERLRELADDKTNRLTHEMVNLIELKAGEKRKPPVVAQELRPLNTPVVAEKKDNRALWLIFIISVILLGERLWQSQDYLLMVLQ